MMRLRSAILLIAFYVLAAVAPVYAECAWVLWEEKEVIVSLFGKQSRKTLWRVHVARETPEACEDMLIRMRDSTVAYEQKLDRKEVESTTNDVLATTAMGDNMFYRFRCLPDTVDPRGPKAK